MAETVPLVHQFDRVDDLMESNGKKALAQMAVQLEQAIDQALVLLDSCGRPDAVKVEDAQRVLRATRGC